MSNKLTFDSNIIITINGSSVTTSPYNLNNGDVITATTGGGYKISINGTLYGGESTININNQDIDIARSTAETFDSLLVTINYTQTATGTNKLKFGTETPSKLYIGETEVTKAYMGETLVYEKASSGGETWLLNEFNGNLTASAIDVNTQFTSNNTNYTRFRCVKSDPFTSGIYYDDVQIWNSSDDYTNQAYRTIKFAKPPTGDLLTWLQANGVKQQ